jgi:mono/diheme cytochrome c family protein
MPRRSLRLAASAALLLALGACDFYYNDIPSPDDLMHAVPWFDHMIRQRFVHPYSRADVPRYTVAGTVPVTGSERDWLAEWTTGNTATADRLVNPTRGMSSTVPGRGTEPGDSARRLAAGAVSQGPFTANAGPAVPRIPASLDARGDTLFQTYCSMCHGAAGAANGTVTPKIGAPSLLTARARGYSDGYLYSIVRYGRGVMPRYSDKIYDPIDRWAVVNHVRKLQAAAPAPATPAAPGAGAAPAPRGAN